jgi:hypothetical protein
MYDYFVGTMTCSSCGTVSPATSATNLQTYIRHNARGIEIPIGYELDPRDILDENIESSGYLPIHLDRAEGQTRLLDTWTCPTCSHEVWARVTLDGTRVAAIEGVTLDRATLASAQFITENCFITAAQISGIPAQDLMMGTGTLDPVKVLLERLP